MAMHPAMAEQRALLVGVGEYQRSDLNLPGIDLDIERMVDTLKVMGFEENQIRTLADSSATAANVTAEFESWLTDGVGKDDRVVFYFSGHGSFIPDTNGDEADNVDEVLVTHDVQTVSENGRYSLTGVVTDDRIAEMIAGTASENILVIVDSCHSGTMTRDIVLANKSLTDEPVYEKSFVYKGMPVGDDGAFSRDIVAVRSEEAAAAPKYVAISAAGDNEKAIGTSRGGVFTIGFTDAIKAGARDGSELTINELRDKAAGYILEKVDASRAHTPQITGSLLLAGGALQMLPTGSYRRPMWERLQRLANDSADLRLESERTSYVVDESVEFTIDVPTDGYLNIVSVDARDTATVLFPNAIDNANRVTAGEFRFPTASSEFEFAAAPPLGETLVVAFVTKEPVDFRQAGFAGREKSGDFGDEGFFTEVSYTATRALKVRRKPETPPAAAAEDAPDQVSEPIPAAEPASTGPAPSMYSGSMIISVKAR
jgi:hypothetical protein